MSRNGTTSVGKPAVHSQEFRLVPQSARPQLVPARGPAPAQTWHWIPFLAGWTVVAVAGAVLCGWLLDIALLKRLLPGTAPMQATTAVAFILAALGLLQRAEAGPRRRGFRWVAAAGLWILATWILVQWLVGDRGGLEQMILLGLSQAARAPIEGRMPVATAVNFLLLGGALVLLDARRGYWLAQLLIGGAVSIALLAFLGHLYRIPVDAAAGVVRPFAFHTVLLFFLLAFGLLSVSSDQGFIAMVRARSVGGWLIRRLLPAALIVPLSLGWLILLGQDAGLYPSSLGLALFALANMIVFAALVGWSAAIVDRMAAGRLWAEQALSASEERFRLLVDAVEDYAIMMLDPQGRVTSWSRGAERILGYSEDAILGEHVSRFVPKSESAIGAPADELAEAIDQGHCLAEGWGLRADGTQFWADAVTSVLRDDAGQVRGFARVVRDMSARRQAEEKVRQFSEQLEHRVAERTAELEAANRELEAFSYSVSHDLRAPLRAIDGFSRIVVQRHAAALPEEARQYLGDVRAATQQMGRLIDDLLAFSRLSRQPLRKQPVPHRALVEDCLADLRRAHPEGTAEIHLGDVADCQADMSMLKQVWTNLLSNALKYTGKRADARIEIGSRPGDGDGATVFFVKDNGVGFDMRYAPKLFGVFQRLHRAEEYEGTGVGLAIVQRIVHRHGGRVWAEAEPDKGATFFFTLP